MKHLTFGDLLHRRDGIIKGPFGGDIKKSLFVPKTNSAYKVYEQGVVLHKNTEIGDYYVSEEYFNKKLSRFEVKPGDYLITGAGTLGEIYRVPDHAPKGVINQALLRIRLNHDVIVPEFFYYYFKYYVKGVISIINGDSVIPNLPPLPIIKATNVVIPERPIQQRIADVLSALDAKIETNNQINSIINEFMYTVFSYWFDQFDFPNYEGKPYKSSGGKLIWNNEIKREIPKGWEIKELTDITSTIMRGISPSYLENGGICVLNQKCIRGNSINFDLSRRHNNEIKDACSKFIEIGDVLVNSTGVGTLGRMAIVKRLPEQNTTVDSHISIVRSDGVNFKKLFVGISLLTRQNEIEALGEGSTGQTELSRANLGHLKMIIPPVNLQTTYENTVQPLLNKIAINEVENQKLCNLRDWLLPMLMNGQVIIDE